MRSSRPSSPRWPDEHPAFAGAASARPWTGGDGSEEDALFASADVVVAFGRDDALRAIRARCGSETRFVPFGHRASVGRLTRADLAALDDALADRVVRDALLYDGEGCLSLHALFVDAAGSDLERVASALAAACERVALEFPGGPREALSTARTAAYRNLATFRAAAGSGAVLRGADATLVIDPPAETGCRFSRACYRSMAATTMRSRATSNGSGCPSRRSGSSTPLPAPSRWRRGSARCASRRSARCNRRRWPAITAARRASRDFVRWIDNA